MKFSQQVVWITGASSGIGESLAKAFAEEGAHLVLSARRESELQRVATGCLQQAGSVLVLPFDMTDLEVHESMLEKVLASYGRIDVMVLNAGVSQRSMVENTKLEVYRTLFEINFFSIVALTQKLLPVFKKQSSGIFVPIASVAGRISTPRRGAYAASKHALIGFFDAVRAETQDLGIHVCTVLPGYIKTNISLNAMNEDGEAYGKMDPNQAKGLDPDVTAQGIVQAVFAKKKEFFIGGKLEALGLFVKRLSPLLLFWMIRKVKNT
ncbi:SDR family oxidoreductase [Aquirufa rosea]|uniref:SDR family oxidoreductase n=1 Tax=Aquirufa rosea TaxID=2509241 RepID=A0A4Q1C1B8_9BACT|nr:SDR family oxidoreductase [Aquirufa rosea]RXK50830.1 SDR family oxidoreductase [Aquirufa rosea]